MDRHDNYYYTKANAPKLQKKLPADVVVSVVNWAGAAAAATRQI